MWLIPQRGKKHECLFITQARPSILNGAFLMLGLEPGKNVSWQNKDPMPTEQEIRDGADWLDVFPPSGAPVWMTFRWQDEAGKAHAMPVEDMLVDFTTGKELADASWIYLGGRMAPLYRGEAPVFVADYSGNLISVPYMTPDNHLLSMVHKHARDEANFWLTKRAPAGGTQGTLVFHLKETALHVARKQRLAKDGARTEEVEERPEPPAEGGAPGGIPRLPPPGGGDTGGGDTGGGDTGGGDTGGGDTGTGSGGGGGR